MYYGYYLGGAGPALDDHRLAVIPLLRCHLCGYALCHNLADWQTDQESQRYQCRYFAIHITHVANTVLPNLQWLPISFAGSGYKGGALNQQAFRAKTYRGE